MPSSRQMLLEWNQLKPIKHRIECGGSAGQLSNLICISGYFGIQFSKWPNSTHSVSRQKKWTLGWEMLCSKLYSVMLIESELESWNPQLIKHCIFKLLANTDIFLQIKTYKIAQYTKQVTTQAWLYYQYPFCSSLSVPWWQSKGFVSTLKLPQPQPHIWIIEEPAHQSQ